MATLADVSQEQLREMGFAPLSGLAHDGLYDARTRAFQGNDGYYLRVPGLKALEGVAHRSAPIPLSITVEFPLDHTLTRLGSREVPLVDLSQAPDGCPVLRRSVLSNDGIWQAVETFFITGDWDEAVPYEPPAAPATEPVPVTRKKN